MDKNKNEELISNKLPHLNSVRTIAAAMVVMGHTAYLVKSMNSSLYTSVWTGLAAHGVDVFFALSGFLITYLLLKESEKHGRIHITHFYMRRIYRIWPLYYLVLFSTLVISFLFSSFYFTKPNFQAFGLSFFMLPEFSKAFYICSFPMSTLWSIGVEELFYLIFPLIFYKLSKLSLRDMCLGLIGLSILKVILIYILAKGGKPYEEWIKLFSMLRFECLFAGVMAAFATKKWDRLTHFVNNPIWLYAVLISFFLFLGISIFDINIYLSEGIGPILKTTLNPLIISLLTAAILLFLTQNKKLIFRRENSVLYYLGKISYGTYVYHTFFISLFYSIFPKSSSGILLFCLVYVMTTLIARLSYRYFETPFLKRSEKFRHL